MTIATIVSVQYVGKFRGCSNVCLAADIVHLASCGANTASYETRPGSCKISYCVPALVYLRTPWFVFFHHLVLKRDSLISRYNQPILSISLVGVFSRIILHPSGSVVDPKSRTQTVFPITRLVITTNMDHHVCGSYQHRH